MNNPIVYISKLMLPHDPEYATRVFYHTCFKFVLLHYYLECVTCVSYSKYFEIGVDSEHATRISYFIKFVIPGSMHAVAQHLYFKSIES